MKKKSLIIFLLVLLCATPVFADALPEATRDFYVYDEANILSEEAKSKIVATNESLYEQTGAQVVIAVLERLPEGEDINTAATELFEKWKIGDKEKDNGVLLLISMADRKFRIEVGYGLEGAIPDMKANQILNDLTPYFKEKAYEEGILKAFSRMLDLIGEEYDIAIDGTENLPSPEPTPVPASDAGGSDIIGLIVRVILLIFIINFFFGGGGGRRGRRRYYRGPRPGPFIFPGGGFGGGFGGGSGGSFGGGGNFGGGGSSGGGGASGGW
nr:TPM domain-containing protein [uncultured Peptoniphilus sp.]